MGLFDRFRKLSAEKLAQDDLKRLAPVLFPGGHDEIMIIGRKIAAYLDNRIPPEGASKIYASTKYFAHTAEDKSRERVIDYIRRQGMGLIDANDAAAVYDRFLLPRSSAPDAVAKTSNKSFPAITANASAPRAQSNATLGSQERPIRIEVPDQLDAIRQKFKQILRETKYKDLSETTEFLDSMIAEEIKVSQLKSLLNKPEFSSWNFGKREYLKGAVQSQQIVFGDGRPSLTLYIDFSRFGGSESWG